MSPSRKLDRSQSDMRAKFVDLAPLVGAALVARRQLLLQLLEFFAFLLRLNSQTLVHTIYSAIKIKGEGLFSADFHDLRKCVIWVSSFPKCIEILNSRVISFAHTHGL